MVNEGATGAILITSGEFTKAASEAASRHGHVQLIDGDELRSMLGPLPEPAAVASARAHAIAAHVGERLLSAAEDRIRGQARRSGSLAVRSAVTTMLLKAALGIVFLVFILIVWQTTMRFVLRTLTHQQSPQVAAPLPAVAPMASAMTPPGIASGGKVDPNPCHELVDWQTGTFIDHCASVSPPKRPTTAEMREQKRKADEAMKVIEATTPEI